MNNDTPFDLNLDSSFDDFDPFAGIESDNEEEFGEDDEPTVVSAIEMQEKPQVTPIVNVDTRTPEERTADLLKSMAPHRKLLLSTLEFCTAPQQVAAVNANLEELKKNHYCVYSGADLCRLLEEAGAIELVDENGEPAENIEQEAQTVVIDGVEYLEAAKPVVLFWRITEAGQAALDADKPVDRLNAMFGEKAMYMPVIKRILTLCSAESGASTTDIGAAVDNLPLMHSPKRLYAPHFIDLLEKCDAVAWEGSWKITNIGRDALAGMADVEDLA